MEIRKMIKSRKIQLVMVLILACICIPLLGAEPNEAEIELEFEIRSSRPPSSLMRRNIQTPFESTHFAILFIKGDWGPQPIKSENALLATSASRTMSPTQREHVSTLPFKFSDFGMTIGNHSYFRLYGVGEEDLKKMVKAFIEVLANKANKEMQNYLSQQQKFQKEISEIKKKLPEKQKQLEAAELKYKEIKDARYSSLTEENAYYKPKETMLEMDKMLDTLEIELAGIEEKLKSIEKYRQRKYADDGKSFSRETLDKLDQMFVEQIIELTSAKARQQAALKIRNREKKFLDLFNNMGSLNVEVDQLKNTLRNSERSLHNVEKILVDPAPEMLPPKVYQNKVSIYPVK